MVGDHDKSWHTNSPWNTWIQCELITISLALSYETMYPLMTETKNELNGDIHGSGASPNYNHKLGYPNRLIKNFGMLR